MKATIYLRDPQTAYQRIKTLWTELKPWLIAGHELELIVRPKRRNTMQNALLHALLLTFRAKSNGPGCIKT